MVESPEVYGPEQGETVCETVVRALADSKGVDPTDLDVHLYDVIEPDALDRLFDSRSDATGRRASFTLADRRVVVDESRTVYVTPTEKRPNQHESPAPVNPQILRGAASPWRMVFSKL
jgi:hypothetical protein